MADAQAPAAEVEAPPAATQSGAKWPYEAKDDGKQAEADARAAPQRCSRAPVARAQRSSRRTTRCVPT